LTTFGSSETEHGSVLATIKQQLPAGGCIEQVPGFGMKAQGSDESALERFLVELRGIRKSDGTAMYPGIRVLSMDAAPWLGVMRTRCTKHESHP
jgi:hypothetical protein